MFDDPLFVRQGHAMVSTPRARNMIDPVRRALRDLEVTLRQPDQFDPASMPRQFKLGVRDVLEATVLPPLLARFGQQAPLVDLAVGRRELESELAAGTLDAAMDVLLPLTGNVLHQRVEQDATVVVARAGQPDRGTGLHRRPASLGVHGQAAGGVLQPDRARGAEASRAVLIAGGAQAASSRRLKARSTNHSAATTTISADAVATSHR
jgi:DNA-binding transcriptional LysR family regulator